MLTAEENRDLTQVGPGTPMGVLLRFFWHPVCASAQLQGPGVRSVGLLGEPLALYRDPRGEMGLLADACGECGMSLARGVPEKRGLRCAYDGSYYDAHGRCIQQPGGLSHMEEGARASVPAYPIREMGGLVFAYLGTLPPPLLPRYNILAWPGAAGIVNGCVIPCNWLQVMENLLDPVHIEWLHGRLFAYVLERKGGAQLADFLANHAPPPIRMIEFDRFADGLIERHSWRSEEEPSWKIGEALFFPTTWLLNPSPTRGSIIFIVPLDDTHTWFLLEMAERRGGPPGPRRPFPYADVPGTDAQGKFALDRAHGQDYAATVSQGEVVRRDLEHLGASDIGLIAYRELLQEQLRLVMDGGQPINVRRGHAQDRVIGIPDIASVSRGPRIQAA